MPLVTLHLRHRCGGIEILTIDMPDVLHRDAVVVTPDGREFIARRQDDDLVWHCDERRLDA